MASLNVSAEGPLQDLDPYFCERCRQIDFEELFRQGIGNVEILTFERGQKLVQDQDCSFCQALDFIYPSLNRRPYTERYCTLALVRKKDSHRGMHGLLQEPSLNGSFYISFLSQQKPDLILWNQETRGHFSWDRVGYLAEHRVIEKDCKSLSSDLITASVDVKIFRRWIDHCETKHRGECLAKPRRVEGVKLIDCTSRTVVNQPDEETKYVALSYVWGLSSFSPGVVWSNDPMPLPENLPTTIADALLVTERLGIQYLWIDRFCIEQEPPDSRKPIKYHQITNMHNIYGGAYVTIIAACGDGPQYGLPGVSTKLRHPFHVRIDSRTLEATLADPKALISASKWSTRAWTYQEGLLSKRRLVFTDQQVYFQCSQMAIIEALEKAQTFRESLHPFSNSPVSPHFSLNGGSIGSRVSVWDKIMHYSHLDLTESGDILNGMLGILQRYQDIGDTQSSLPQPGTIERMRHISGLPIHIHNRKPTSWITAISRNLPWISVGSGERRSGFPSWSWTGWTYKTFEDLRAFSDLEPMNILGPCITIEMEDGTMIEGSELEDRLSTKQDLSEPKLLHITAISLKVQLISRPFTLDSTFQLTNWNRVHNAGKLVVNYEEARSSYPLNLTDLSILSSHQTMTGIVLDQHLGIASPKHTSYQGVATVLLIVQKDQLFERVGVSRISRSDLELIGTTLQSFSIA